jgi:NTP pyrophosphatase (non-canonical NTP hydrolase)
MNGKDYQDLAMRTNDGKATERLLDKAEMIDFFKQAKADRPTEKYDLGGILNGCLGLSGEAGEFNDMMKKWIFHEKELDVDHAQKEVGDILWYIAMICHSFGWDMDEIMQKNIEKLKARYPDGFDVDLSAHRKAGDV